MLRKHSLSSFELNMRLFRYFVVAATVGILISGVLVAGEYMNGIEWDEPKVVVPGKTPGAPPSDATILFDGSNTSAWKDVRKMEGRRRCLDRRKENDRDEGKIR